VYAPKARGRDDICVAEPLAGGSSQVPPRSARK
jgi:hypothetical protein